MTTLVQLAAGWVLLSFGAAAVYASGRVSQRGDARVLEVGLYAAGGTLSAIAGGALILGAL